LDKHKIDSLLTEIKQKNFEINAELNEAIFCAYCSASSIADAQNWLNEMKSKNLALNENMFNALITCYLRNGKETEANQVYNLMKMRSIEHTSATYHTFFEHYLVGKRDLPSFENMFAKMESENLKLSATHALSIVAALLHNRSDLSTIAKFLQVTKFELLGTDIFYNHYLNKIFMN
jgi:pentatricopeptide repeat protein